MIHKSYLVEKNFRLISTNCSLFYGENHGLINDFKKKIKELNLKKNILKFEQDEIIKNSNLLLDEVKNKSLFEEEKIIFISNVNDSFLRIFEELRNYIGTNKIYLFSEILEKKSKLRSFFEKSDSETIIACYKDNEISLKNHIQLELNDFKGLTPQVINLLIDNCGFDRMKLNNEIDKIKNFFINKIIEFNKLDILLNIKSDEGFENIKDAALKGERELTNKLLSTTIFEVEKVPLYITLINIRLQKMVEVTTKSKGNNLLEVINNLKPQIFWKDKPVFLEQMKLWDLKKLNLALKKNYELELKVKSNSTINKDILIKKILLDICLLANT